MTAKYTPGPWAHEPAAEIITTACVGRFGHRHVVARVFQDYADKATAPVEVMCANAALISAAPELLYVLREAYENVHKWANGAPAQWIERARSAIGKAEGADDSIQRG